MNEYTKNINRIEFVITMACTGRCKHCSEGEHVGFCEYIDGDAGAQLVSKVAEKYDIRSLMTFGGEPLLYPEEVCKIHRAARDANIPKRQLITNGLFSKDVDKIQAVARMLADSGVTDVALSVDAFHQETIPLEPVKCFAEALLAAGVPLRTHPAWIQGRNGSNPYDRRTAEILEEFEELGIAASEGNVIFPSGNALKYLGEFFEEGKDYVNPYEESPEDIRTISVNPNGDVLGGNIYQKDIMDIIEGYTPQQGV